MPLQVDRSLKAARLVLSNERAPKLGDEVPHRWSDKFALVNVVTNTYLSAVLNVLELLGLSVKGLRTVRAWVEDEQRSVTFRLSAEEKCEFVREEKREEDSKTKYVSEYTAVGGAPLGKRTDKTVHTITEFFWRFTMEYRLVAYVGNSPDDHVLLQSRSGVHEIKTMAKMTPRPESVVRDYVDLNATWLVQQMGEHGFAFQVDRAAKTTHTPRRNAGVDAAFQFAGEWHRWCNALSSYFTDTLFTAQEGHGLDLAALRDENVFVPDVPVMELAGGDGKQKEEDDDAAAALMVPPAPTEQTSAVVLSDGDVNALLAEQKRSLSEKCAELGRVFPDGGAVVTAAEAIIVLAARHGARLAEAYADGVQHVEELIRRQLVAAIGKAVSTQDFAEYMIFHGRKLFAAEYRPRPFAYAVRRPDHHPEGIVSVENRPADGSMAQPIHTLVSSSVIPPQHPFTFSLHDAAEVSFSGECLVHGWMNHVFAQDSSTSLTLHARARQFSSFLVLVGRITGPGQFDPQYGMIVQNKTEMSIPLDLEMIPSAGEFADAIESLSPEQQRFAQMYRSMQLASTLFGVCVLQIKPQMERLLKLPDDSLTKEIRLTQDVLEMFIKYQIPSDLLSFGDAASLPDAAKVDRVKKHVEAMQEMIDSMKHTEIVERKPKAEAPVKPLTRFFDAMKRKKRGGKTSGAGKAGAVGPSNNNNNNNNDVEVQQAAEPDLRASVDFVSSGDSFQLEHVRDLTEIPRELDQHFEQLDEDKALRPTIINVGNSWQKHEQAKLLGAPKEVTLGVVGQKLEKDACYDLLDALSKSGVLPFEDATLHVVVAATHVFGDSVMDTLVKCNVNPIERVERSQLIMASTIHQRPVGELLSSPAEANRIAELSPAVLTLKQ